MTNSSTFEYLVKKYNLNLDRHLIEIPNINRLELARWIRELDLRKGVEIGVDRAEFSKILCHGNPQFRLYGIDPYVVYPEYTENYTEETFSETKKEAATRMTPFMRQFTFMYEFSEDAAKKFEDNSLDFVYIDANHEGEFPLIDMRTWWPKLKEGGIMSGHDYIKVRGMKYSVRECVHRFVKDYKLKHLFILGAQEKEPRIVRDWSRSWMLIK